MKPSTALLVILPLVLVVAAFVLVGTRGAGAGSLEDGVWWDEQIASFVRRKVATTYVDQIDEARAAQAFYKALDAYVRELDEYCDFIPPEEHRKWQEDTAGEYAGLGIKIQKEDDGLAVVGVLPGGPAHAAGLHNGDTIVSADGTRLAGLEIDTIEATRLLKGKPGTVVRVGVIRGPRPPEGPAQGPEVVVPVTRAVVRPPSVVAHRVGKDQAFGLIRLTEFNEATEEDFNGAVDAMLPQGVKGFILDLRGNGGGVLPTAVAVVDRFVRRGLIVRMEGRASYATRLYEAKEEGTLPDTYPLVVLINGSSASASEVVAGALQDHRRALLVGERSYGKFLVQQITDVPGRDAALQLTTSRYYLPSGRSYQRPPRPANGRRATGPPSAEEGEEESAAGGGLLPDVVVPLAREDRERLEMRFANEEAEPWGEDPPFPEVDASWTDAQLERAIDLLEGQMVLQKIRAGR